MTTTSRAPALAAPAPGDPASASAVAIISDAPVPHPTMVRTFAAMMAREFRVLGQRPALNPAQEQALDPLPADAAKN